MRPPTHAPGLRGLAGCGKLLGAGPFFASLSFAGLAACKGQPDDAAWCGDSVVTPAPADGAFTWWRDVHPIVEQKCARCHTPGGHAPFPLEEYADAFDNRAAIRAAVAARTMPPWLAADCCSDWFQDFSLTDPEIATLLAWIDADAPEGDPAEVGEALPPVGGLSRVDLTLTMDEPYTPEAPAGVTDIQHCFVLDWPLDEEAYVTGLSPQPGAREIVHHLIVSQMPPTGVAALHAKDAADASPGFDCTGGLGDLPTVTPLGGSLLGGDYPRGLGSKVVPGSKIVLQIHYSLSTSPPVPDLTSVQMRIDDEAVGGSGLVIANPGWLVAGGMPIEAGDADAGFWYRFHPNLFTGGKPVDFQGVTPHMHRYASRMRLRAQHPDGTSDCLLEIPDWQFGWEQPYWYAEPHRFDPSDELYLECHFDNSAANQPDGGEPRDIGWGENDQDMCAAFVSFTPVSDE
jgi:hypothetical protein